MTASAAAPATTAWLAGAAMTGSSAAPATTRSAPATAFAIGVRCGAGNDLAVVDRLDRVRGLRARQALFAAPGAPVGADAAAEGVRLLRVDADADRQRRLEQLVLAATDQAGDRLAVGEDRTALGEVGGEQREVVVVAEQFG